MTLNATIWLADSCPANTEWLTQPKATVAAAVIAVIGALIAYAGVTKTTRTTRRESRRAEKVAVLTEAFGAAHELTRGVGRVVEPDDAAIRAGQVAIMDAGPMKELGNQHSMMASKLALYGFTNAATLMNTLNDTLAEIWRSIRTDPTKEISLENSYAQYDLALKAIYAEFEKLR